MGVWRKWIFPSIRIVLVVVIAVALAKLAFFPDRAPAQLGAFPTGTTEEATMPVQRGSIANDVVLTGTVNADDAVPVKATGTGTVDEVFFTVGAAVHEGDKLFDIKVVDELDPTTTTGPDGVPVVTMPAPSHHFEKVFAAASGTLSSLDVLPGQAVSVGQVSGKIAPPSFNVTASIAPAMQYRLKQRPSVAQVVISGGPAPFTCTGLTITTPLSGGGQGGEDGVVPTAAGTAAAATVTCRVPADVRVFPGLAAEVTISAGAASDVLVVPSTAVEGGAETGVVWVVGSDGGHAERPVTLGLTDGKMVEIVEGLAEGDTVLQFVPGAVAPPEGACTTLPDGSTACMEGP
ncbi:efflux RND transporter periplasmic adaptor subunit [Agromyces sp. NPDC058484]|uniref:efflux RND transporter periplasmic adaptor subunit n=1 Tax=Agromyces sp. NPDC058484 TaxID=3346524 RepID=UPI003659C054